MTTHTDGEYGKLGAFFAVKAERYAQSIKSPGKRTYAWALAKRMQGLLDFDPQAATCGCSLMAAQAVRMNLEQLATESLKAGLAVRRQARSEAEAYADTLSQSEGV